MIAPQTPEQKVSILIVDDTPNNLRFLSSMLLEQGYEVRKAINGNMALRSADADPPDLILLDIRMPDMSGYEVCQNLKNKQNTREIPVIFLSALSEEKDKVTAFDVGGVDYVMKPFQFQEVLARVRIHLTIQQQKKQLIHQKTLLEQEVRARAEAELALQKANQELQRLANLDSATHVANRRRFDEYLELQWKELLLSKIPLSLILCELDNFEHYLEVYGDSNFDDCLRTIAWAINRRVQPPKDLVARFNETRFAILLPHKALAETFKLAEQIRLEIQALKMNYSSQDNYPNLRLSLGVSSIIPTVKSSPKELVNQSLQGLQEAIQQGRDRAVIHQ